jgi:hypothetical protein
MVCARIVMGRGGATSGGAVTIDQGMAFCLIIYIIWQTIESLPTAEVISSEGSCPAAKFTFGPLA